ncbi:hypothetical protein J6590_088542, partial [Homalodisca vitripennis]
MPRSTSVFKKSKRVFWKKTVETEIMKNKDISRLKNAQRMISEVAKRSRQSRESAKRKLEMNGKIWRILMIPVMEQDAIKSSVTYYQNTAYGKNLFGTKHNKQLAIVLQFRSGM